MSAFSKFRRKFTKSAFKLAGSKLGSVLTGRFIVERKIQKRDLQAGGGKLIDLFGSPATAGTKQQTTARVGAVVFGGVVAAGAVAGGTAVSGGAAGGVASGVAATSATGWASTIASIGKYSALGLALSRQFGIGPGAPQYGPETIPSENFLPNGLPGAIYPGYSERGFGVDSFLPPPSESGAAGFFGTSTIAPFIMVGVILLLGIFIAFRR